MYINRYWKHTEFGLTIHTMNFHNLQHTRLLESRGVLMTVCSIKELCVVVGNNRRQTVHIDVIYIYIYIYIATVYWMCL